ncbi:hypothetical protein [Halorhabdus rudnickae]|uniref:hypothetical protein n=1 Tax=Halorhabdus rudnickae TaxID=1775544 RepID=UPI001AEF6081|nr:hypothetical protein [Halorhabdus rudnickae]
MSEYPEGAVALVEAGRGHHDFLEAVKPRYAIMKYHHANRLLKRGETAESWFPEETTVITSTNVIDNRNAPIPLEDNGHRRGEIDIVREFEPDFHIPADRSDYRDFDDAKRYEKTKECMTGTVTVANHIADHGLETRVIPFVKTTTPAERELCYRTIDQLGYPYAAVYCNQYFNDGRGVLIDELLEDLEMLARESKRAVEVTGDSPLRLLTVSLLSPNVLERGPDAVVAGSGQMVGTERGWRESIKPRVQEADEMRRVYADVEERVAAALPDASVGEERVRDNRAEEGQEQRADRAES